MTAPLHNLIAQRLPEYSDQLVSLARAYDRAALAVNASVWHLAGLRDDAEHYVEGDGSMSDWTRVRIELLEDQLPALASVIDAMIVAESKPWYEVAVRETGGVVMPPEVETLLENNAKPAFYYRGMEDGIAKAQTHLADHYVILFEGDGYIVPRHYPKSFVEIWWRRYWWTMSSPTFYDMALVEKPAYGWDCYGHEL